MQLEVRPGDPADEGALLALDLESWSTSMTPAPPPGPGATFFDEKTQPSDVLVAVADGELAGYVKVVRPTPLAASGHVSYVSGLVVSKMFRRRGVGRALMGAAVEQARRRGDRRITLRVLGPNDGARRLYESLGFVVEGVQRGEFFLDGDYVDDVLMALDLTAAVS